jgi:hypothetical protein
MTTLVTRSTHPTTAALSLPFPHSHTASGQAQLVLAFCRKSLCVVLFERNLKESTIFGAHLLIALFTCHKVCRLAPIQ